MAKKLSPPPKDTNMSSTTWQQFFQGVQDGVNNPKFYEKSGNPLLSEIPRNTFSVWKNTTSGTVRLWANNNGTLVSVLLS